MNKRSNELNDEKLGTVSGGRIRQMADGSYLVLSDTSDDEGAIQTYGSAKKLRDAQKIAKKNSVSDRIQ